MHSSVAEKFPASRATEETWPATKKVWSGWHRLARKEGRGGGERENPLDVLKKGGGALHQLRGKRGVGGTIRHWLVWKKVHEATPIYY